MVSVSVEKNVKSKQLKNSSDIKINNLQSEIKKKPNYETGIDVLEKIVAESVESNAMIFNFLFELYYSRYLESGIADSVLIELLTTYSYERYGLNKDFVTNLLADIEKKALENKA